MLGRAHILVDGDASDTTLTSYPVDARFCDDVGIQCVWDGAAVGTFTVQASNTYSPEDGTGTWSEWSVANMPEATGSSGDGVSAMYQFPFAWFRVVYTKISGTGTVNVVVSMRARQI